jgi:MFS family permease
MRMIKFTNLLMTVGVLMSIFDQYMWVVALGRFIWGLSVGFFTILCPKYINETGPTEIKGPLGTIN